MTESRILDLVDSRDFRTLFIDELGWENPDQPDLNLAVDDASYELVQVAGYKGLRIWHCGVLPPRKTQRVLDVLVGKDSHERLIIFTNVHRQEWRWPRRSQLGGINAKLLAHEHIIGERNTNLVQRLQAIELDFDEDLPLVELLGRMRDAFDAEAEAASVQAARMMGSLYTALEASGASEHDATLLLARLLFLLFGDDAEMSNWEPGLFEGFVRDHTSPETLHAEMQELFEVLNTAERKRNLADSSPLASFRYINGGLYKDTLNIPVLSKAFRDTLLEACKFDWAIISPAIFGSMFQTVKTKEARRYGGEHYTTEENILKTIRPLFLDEYVGRLKSSWDDKAQLTKLHNDLGRLRLLDPACGCGNFLIVAYRELRAIELEILKRRRDLDLADGMQTRGIDRSQTTIDVSGEIKVTLDHFYGIEIEEWPARIAETAMLLVDHLANLRMAQEFGVAPDRLPITVAPVIRLGNALDTDWSELIRPSEDVVIFGNPPFNGARTLSSEGRRAMEDVWGKGLNANFDFVTAWYKKSLDYFGKHVKGRWGFVSTNSICQGEPVADLWQPILDAGWRCRFAHRSFAWDSEAPGKAAVHVSIVGFDKQRTSPRPRLWVYPENAQGEAALIEAANINPYLVDGPSLLVRARRAPISPALPVLRYGSMPNDGGNLIVEPGEELMAVRDDPVAAKFLRPFQMGRELVNEIPRYCLWLTEASVADIAESELLRERVEAVKRHRLESTRKSTRDLAMTPQLFGEIRQPTTRYLAIPMVVTSSRTYFTVKSNQPAVIAGNKISVGDDPDGFLLGVLSSSMFIVWMKSIGGRLKSDLNFSISFTYNTFPLPIVTERQRTGIVKAAGALIAARESHPGTSLAKLYDPQSMPQDLVEAHIELDVVVDALFGQGDLSSLAARQKVLFRNYANLTGQERLL